ncbi:MAG: response regulator [Ferruginibacter sp.]|nr:response regulator [Cytophagales bacterium]
MRKFNQILLVDDDPINNFLNEEILRDLQITNHIEVLLNGQQALAYLRQVCQFKEAVSCPALVLFDHFMPVMDGLEFIQALHQIDFIPQHNAIFVLLGIHTNQADVKTFQELGVHEFTTKPLSKEFLMDVYHKYWDENSEKRFG